MTRHNASEKIGVYHTASPPKIAARRRSTALCSASPRPTEIEMAGTGHSMAVINPPMTMLKPSSRYETL